MAPGEHVMARHWQLSATELARAFARGETTPEAHLDQLLARIERINPKLNAIIALNPGARAAARESGERIAAKRARGPLEGVPVTVKDSIPVAGLRCTWGSRLYKHYVPEADALPVARLRAAGAVIVGKTNVPEFTIECYTWNPVFGVTRNPWDTALTPGGSSGGAVASVAAGLVPLAIGTDAGGSIRRPASHTGLVGLKPSIDRVARGPSLPQILIDMEVIGPIARTAEDAALLFGVIAGSESLDRPARIAGESLSILYVPRFGAAPLDSEIAESVDQAARALAALGHRVEQRAALPFELARVDEHWPIMQQVGIARLLEQHPGKEELLGPILRGVLEAGCKVSATRYCSGIEAVGDLRRAVTEAFRHFDLIMTPSAAALPWPAAQAYPDTIDGSSVGPRGNAIYTGWVNACGHPAIALPCAPSRSGLPIGFQLVGRFGADDALLDLARQYEAGNPWRERWPELALEGGA